MKRAYLRENWLRIREDLLSGTYRPSPLKRQPIAKSGGGVRELGIPTVLDRFIQQLSPLLANVLLDEVDKELERRGHAFVRYAE